MREKSRKVVVTFHTTSGAMGMEKACKAQAVPGRLIPVPRAITSDCGMAWMAPVADRETVERVAQSGAWDLAGIYEMEL